MRRLADATIAGLAVLAWFCPGSPAALIRGVVTDTLTTAPVESVLVQVKNTAIQTLTDVNGAFTINTTAGVRTPGGMSEATAGSPADTRAAVYGANGTVSAAGPVRKLPGILSRLPDGVYLVVTRTSGSPRVAKIVNLNGIWQTADFVKQTGPDRTSGPSGSAGKAAAVVTLVYMHPYYTTKEAAANEGDTAVAAKLAMWWPDSTNTGVPTGTVLTPYTGGTVIDGAVIQNQEITGGLDISASNVTVRNCKIHMATGYFGILLRTGQGLVVQDCEICSTNDSGLYTAIAGSNMTVSRCHIHGWENGLSVGSNVVVEDCYIHDPCTYAGAHVDGMEWGSSGNSSVVRHNHITIRDETGCVNIAPYSGGTATNNTVRNNLFAGGTYSLYIRGDGGGTVSGVNVLGNVWVKNSYVYGTASIVSATNITWAYNCLSDGTPVPQ